MGKYTDLAEKIGKLVDDKNAAYGSSFDQAGDFLKLLYPNGIPVDSYTDMLCVVRIFDKLKRIATRKDAFGESPYGDIVGYGLLGLYKDGGANKVENAEPVSEPEPYTPAPNDVIQARAEEAAEKKSEQEKSFEEKRTDEQGYYKLNTVMQDRAKAEYEEQQKAKIKEMIEARQKAFSSKQTTEPVPAEESKKKEVEEPKLVKAKCKICGIEVDQLIDEREIKSGKIVVHQDCYTKWQREQNLKQQTS